MINRGRRFVDGQGRNGGTGQGTGGRCTCPACGNTIAHVTGSPCNQISCPKCGTTMTR